eukprot:TRINITY_DN2292_c0_g1_i1.p1 TRINITY_DN2292_c0_g1~~TRINITY_DN2292_c0_g1_i1.p1  ORF type:complete len:513 (+),score=203.63 TRINITY_DN2292_c0_g1_i1:222-1760(+)
MAKLVVTGGQAALICAVVFYGYLSLPWYLYPLLIALFAEAVTQVLESLPEQQEPAKKASPRSEPVTVAELAKHNTASSPWLAINGKVYDVSEWLTAHPGGKEHLLLMAGRDATEVFESYHPFGQRAAAVLPKLLVAPLDDSARVLPTYPEDKSGFYKTLRERVGAFIEREGIDSKAMWPGVWRMALVLATAATCYWAMHVAGSPLIVRILAAAVYGACQALPLLHIMHDCSHTAWGHSETGWKWAGRLMMDWYAGASMTSWHNQHVVGHHVHTNVMGADPDLPVDLEHDIRRLTPRQVWKAQYKYQYLYLLPLYGLLGLKFRVQDIMLTFIERANGPIDVNPIASAMWAKQVTSKITFLFWRLLFPHYIFGAGFGSIFGLFLIAEMCTGWYLALNFQVSHVSTAAVFPDRHNEKEMAKLEWARLQVATSVDYAHDQPLMTFLCGALNFQTVHHLFPSVSQYLYPQIAPIVREVCKEHGVEFNYLNTFGEALKGHVEHLRIMGLQEGESKKVQ